MPVCEVRAQPVEIRKVCSNEIELFCKGKSGQSLIRCLGHYAGDATAACQEKLKGLPAPAVETAPVWGSLAKIEGAPEAVDVTAANGALAQGFDLTVVSSQTYYDVHGSRSKDIISGMNSSGLLDGVDGSKGSANTGYSISLSYQHVNKAGGCAVISANVQLTVTQHLPRWETPPDAVPGLRKWWRVVSSVMQLHEDGHKDIDMRTGQNIVKYIKALPTMSSCDDLDQAVKAALHRGTVESTQQNVAYDRDNEHGRKQFEKAMADFRHTLSPEEFLP